MRPVLGILNLCLVFVCVFVSGLNFSRGFLLLGVLMAALALINLACGLANLSRVFRD